MDLLSRRERSENMRRIRSKHTAPEIRLRKLVHSLGFSFALHRATLPGRPDLCFPVMRKAIFLHGCFWHSHGRCKIARIPKSRREYWVPKLRGNKERDTRNRRRLRHMGWRSLVIWECQLADADKVTRRIRAFLKPDEKGIS